ncbi:site-2 protease family protein, partial [Nocardioides sp.]|uniref:site-2 protease family protein n=1 Tax=Nocardioides sp. TaxID=35761 RepID=UPI002735F004
FTQLISDARAAEWELVGEDDHDRLFYRMAWWKKVIVMAGGPSVNIAIAFVIFLAVFATYGNPGDAEPEPGPPQLAVVSECVIAYTEGRGRECTPQDPVAPAAEAGLRPGDTIVEFNGTAVRDWDQFQQLVRGNADGAATIVYERDGTQVRTTTNTTVEPRPLSEDDLTLTEVGFLGVTPTARLVTGGPLYTLGEMGTMTVRVVDALANLPVRVWGVGRAIVGLQERDPDSPISIVGGGRIAGEVTSQEGFPVLDKAIFLLMLIAGFNFFIGMFNFIPLLPLDGGHIAGALFEAVRRGLARIFKRPDPGYVDVAKLLPVAYVVGSCLLVMGVVLIIGDLVVPLRLT